MQIKDWKKEIFTIPNVLSMIRLALIPVYITIYLNAEDKLHYYLSAGILAVSCITDLIDGQIARRFNMISTLGKILDPIADKATQFTLIVCLLVRRNLPLLWGLCILFVVKESFQIVAGSIFLKKKKILSGALITGKIATAILFCSLVLLIMFPELSDQFVTVISLINSAFLIISFCSYVLAYTGKIKKIENLE